MTDTPCDHQSDPFDEERDALFAMINRFLGYFTRESQRFSQNDESSEYPFVPMDTRQMFYQVKLVHDHLHASTDREPPFSFLDIGCGIGNVLLAAEVMDFEVFGFEKDEFPCKIGQKLMGDDIVQEGDIWEFDEYQRFDVIYYFRPFHDGDTQRRFERFIEDQLKPGGILIANRKMSNEIDTDPRFTRLHEEMPVWEKISAHHGHERNDNHHT